jgi:Flp pilus assembly protein TadD
MDSAGDPTHDGKRTRRASEAGGRKKARSDNTGTETDKTMSKKGQKGRAKKKTPGAGRVPAVAAASVNPPAEAAPVVAALPPVEPAAEAVAASKPLETPIAFESPRVIEPAPLDPVRAAEASIPPVDLDAHFFEKDVHHHELVEEHEERDPRMVLKLAPAAVKRRAQLQRYVKLAVGAASVLCLAALVKVAVARNHEEPAARRASASMQIAPPPVAEPAQAPQRAQPVDEVPPPPPPAVTDTTPAATAAAVAASAPAAVPTPAPVAAPSATDTAPAAAADAPAPTEPDPKAAAKEKHASQLALERGKAAEAIEAGERSVALDPSDAEAWLILGAAYQEKGDLANARKSFKSCLTEGKRGPKWECAQFPH